jgi:carboxyl-terminal processing protease
MFRTLLRLWILLLFLAGCSLDLRAPAAQAPSAVAIAVPSATALPAATPLPTVLPAAPSLTPTRTPSPEPTLTPSPTFEPLEPTPTLAPLVADQQLAIFTEVWETVRDRYLYEDYRGNDWNAVRAELEPRVLAATTPEAFYLVMREMIDRLADDHSRFETPQDVAAQQAEFAGNRRYGGIGATIRTVDEGGLVLNLAPNGPAVQAGIQPRDLILAVNGIPFTDTAAFGPSGPVGMVRGDPGTPVMLTVRTAGRPDREVEVFRAVIPYDVFNQVTVRRLADNIGYIDIPSFYVDELDGKVRAAVETLLAEGELAGLIIDVRNNSGGYVHLMRNTVALFHDGGSIGSTSGRNERTEQIIPTGQTIAGMADVPITILIGEDSASAAEMFAAGMQVLGRATLVGLPTAGNTENLYSYTYDDGSRLLLAQVAYRLPDGTLIEDRGALPDRVVDVEWWRYDLLDDPQVLVARDVVLGAVVSQ